MTQTSDKTWKDQIASGLDAIVKPIASTLGPCGQNVLLYNNKAKYPAITKDGATIAKFVQHDDVFVNAVIQLVKQASRRTNRDAGDGTTTTALLTQSIYTLAERYGDGRSPIAIKRQIDAAVDKVAAALKEYKNPVRSEDDILHIATVSANGDKRLGKTVAMAMIQAGKDGTVLVKEDPSSSDTTLEILEGYRVESGFLSASFVTDERRNIMNYHDALVLVTDETIKSVKDIFHILEIVGRERKPLIVVAENVVDEALAALIMNKVRGTMPVAAIRAPSFGEHKRNILKDLALVIGATYVSKEHAMTLEDVKLADLGKVGTVEATQFMTTFVDGGGDMSKIEDRLVGLRETIKEVDDPDKGELVQERITKLSSGVAVIHVGGNSEVEIRERKDRVDDAIGAIVAAQRGGMLPGGGRALYYLADKLSSGDDTVGEKILYDAMRTPYLQMAKNAGEDGAAIIKYHVPVEATIEDVYDFVEEKVVNCYTNGIVDPADVTIGALKNAASVAGLLMTTDFAVYHKKTD
jgi:chaperonin GroEL